jgi:hypothetical protein
MRDEEPGWSSVPHPACFMRALYSLQLNARVSLSGTPSSIRRVKGISFRVDCCCRTYYSPTSI